MREASMSPSFCVQSVNPARSENKIVTWRNPARSGSVAVGSGRFTKAFYRRMIGGIFRIERERSKLFRGGVCYEVGRLTLRGVRWSQAHGEGISPGMDHR